jgi:hypothetical protein
MLHEFLSANHTQLISRCRLKVSQRSSPDSIPTDVRYGVPLILKQLVDALTEEERTPTPQEDALFGYAAATHGSAESRRTSALHGAELIKLGYTVEQVVHDYGDVCQAITELARELNAPVTVDEFHTVNRFLDDAIATAVSAFSVHGRRPDLDDSAESIHHRLGALAAEQRMLLDRALKALDVLKGGNIGVLGATGKVLEDSLLRMRDIVDRSLPAIRTASGMVTPPVP